MKLSNYDIANALHEWGAIYNISPKDILYNIHGDNILTIYTDKPRVLIGKAGNTIQHLRDLLNQRVEEHNQRIEKINQTRNKNEQLPYYEKVLINFVEATRGDFWYKYEEI